MDQRWAALAKQVRVVISVYPKLKLTQGRKVLPDLLSTSHVSISERRGNSIYLEDSRVYFSNGSKVLYLVC